MKRWRGWLRRIGGARVRARNFIAGLSVAGLLLPEAVAYAAIAGLPVQRAVMAAILGCLAYAAVGGSRFAIVSPTSSSAAIVAATLAAMPISGNQRADLATAVVLAVAALFLLAALVRLGGLTQMVSRPVLRGFAFGVAATVILRQWPQMVGVEVASGTLRSAMTASRDASVVTVLGGECHE